MELALSILLTATLIFAPLTMASIGRRFWIKYKFTNKRVIIQNTSPLFKNEVGTRHNSFHYANLLLITAPSPSPPPKIFQIQLLYSDIKEVRVAPRSFGFWGDMVLFTKRGERLELIGMEDFKQVRKRRRKW